MGKTHVAIALDYDALKAVYQVLPLSMNQIIEELILTEAEENLWKIAY